MFTIKINILGADYTLTVSDDDKRLGANCDGYCDETTKTLAVKSYKDERDDLTSKGNLDVQIKKNMRHEIIHAFLFESGLAENSEWAQNEEIVDWIAIQLPKLAFVCHIAECM